MHSIRSERLRAARPRQAPRGAAARIAAALALTACLLAACGGGGPPEQAPAARNELSGIATANGTSVLTAGIGVKGASGPSRTNGFSADPSKSYAVSTERLGAPFMVGAPEGNVFSVATSNGRANVTPLTTLLTMALFGQPASDAFNDYGDASIEQIALINDAEIQRAQADATDFLENSLQVRVLSGDASFITAPFQPAAGDPMWDTLSALDARIAELGPEAYDALLTAFLRRQQQCRQMQIHWTLAGQATRFCPDQVTATADESGDGVLRHVFSQATGETLTLRIGAETVLDVAYVAADGTTYTCTGPACAGLSLGPAAFDSTRRLTLSSLALAGDGASANATGHLTTTVPDVALAELPCFVGYVHQINADGTVNSECVDNSTALFSFNVTGTVGSQQGASTTVDYATSNLDIVLNGSELVSVTAVVLSADGSSSVTAACRGSACQGVTIGPATVNTNFGIATGTRTVQLDGTVLQALDAEGQLTGESSVRLKAALRLIYYSNVEFNYATPNVPPSCDGGLPLLARVAPDDTPSWVYQVCPFDSLPLGSTPLDTGGIEISFNGQILISTDGDGQVNRVRISASYANVLTEHFGCDGVDACRDVRLAEADSNGLRHLSIVGAVFRNVGFDGFASGPRTGRIDAAFDVMASL